MFFFVCEMGKVGTRDAWKSTTGLNGTRFVMNPGTRTSPRLSADSLATVGSSASGTPTTLGCRCARFSRDTCVMGTRIHSRSATK